MNHKRQLGRAAAAAVAGVALASVCAWSSVALAAAAPKAGMVVVDRQGRRVGVVTATGLSDNGRPAVKLLVNGGSIDLPVDRLAPTRDPDEATVELTPSEIEAADILGNG